MKWIQEAERELTAGRRAESEGNHGRARVCARRAAGHALNAYSQQRGNPGGIDSLKLLEWMLKEDVASEVKDCCRRLLMRVREDFTSDAKHPLDDARTIIGYIAKRFATEE